MLVLVAMAVFVLTCSAVGLRLLWVAFRSGASAAWSCGLGFTFIALIGYPLNVASGNGMALVGEVDHALNAAGMVFVCAGLSSFFAFTLTTFRLRAPWAWALTGAAVLGLAVTAFGQIGSLGSADRAAHSREVTEVWSQAINYLSAICYAWIGIEGLLEWSRAKKRVALGLTDALVADRFLMWGMFGVSTTGLDVFLIALSMLADHESTVVLRQLALTGFGLISAITVALAFFPPPAYARWVRGRVLAGAR
jgi:hypothetical protein